jgi:hypothetical protein
MCSITAGEIIPDVEQVSTGDEFEFKLENDDPESGVRDIHGNRILCAGGVGGRGDVEIFTCIGEQRLMSTGDLTRSPSRVFVGVGGPHTLEAGMELIQEWVDLLGERRSNKLRFVQAGFNKRLPEDDGGGDGGARVSCTKGGEGNSGISYSRRLVNIATLMESLDDSKEVLASSTSR